MVVRKLEKTAMLYKKYSPHYKKFYFIIKIFYVSFFLFYNGQPNAINFIKKLLFEHIKMLKNNEILTFL